MDGWLLALPEDGAATVDASGSAAVLFLQVFGQGGIVCNRTRIQCTVYDDDGRVVCGELRVAMQGHGFICRAVRHCSVLSCAGLLLLLLLLSFGMACVAVATAMNEIVFTRGATLMSAFDPFALTADGQPLMVGGWTCCRVLV